MQIETGMAGWGQMDLAPGADYGRCAVLTAQNQREGPAELTEPSAGEKKKEETYEPSDEALLLLYVEKLQKGSTQTDHSGDELKALRIAHNIMRGKKVPGKDESFLLTHNFKLYMAAKNIASMKGCTGTAKSELGESGGSPRSSASQTLAGASFAGGTGTLDQTSAGVLSAAESGAAIGEGEIGALTAESQEAIGEGEIGASAEESQEAIGEGAVGASAEESQEAIGEGEIGASAEESQEAIGEDAAGTAGKTGLLAAGVWSSDKTDALMDGIASLLKGTVSADESESFMGGVASLLDKTVSLDEPESFMDEIASLLNRVVSLDGKGEMLDRIAALLEKVRQENPQAPKEDEADKQTQTKEAAVGKTAAAKTVSFAREPDYSRLLEGFKKNTYTPYHVSRNSSRYKKKKNQRFHYNFKRISSQILSAKTSGNARQVLTRAKQVTAQIRRKLKSGMYDGEAVKLALIHAEAMERIAKKKMKHLLEEERASKIGGPCAGDTDEAEIREQQQQDEQMLMEMKSGQNPGGYSYTTATDESVPIEDVSIEELLAEAMQAPILDITDGMEELMDDFSELMAETLEEVSNLNEFAEDMLSGAVGRTIDPADLEAKKRKHRTEEQRAIAEADSKYLKAFFNKLQREQQAVASGAVKIAEAMNNGGGVLSLASASASAGGGAPAVQASTAPAESSAPAEPAAEPSLTSADLSISAGTAVSAVVPEAAGGMEVSA